jgi:RNA polymerase sigma factor for flagellar operon FliA
MKANAVSVRVGASSRSSDEKPAKVVRSLAQGNTAALKAAAAAAQAAKLAKDKLSIKTGPAARTGRKKITAATAKTREEFDSLPINDLWAEYAKNQRKDLRNYFMERYQQLVRYIAEKTYTRLPDEVDVNDLISAGQFGLMDAIDGFDLARGVKFETFSATRIKGAIIDELRAMDWVPRLVRSRTAKVSTIRDKFEMKHGRAPTDDEVSTALGATGEDLDKILKDSGAVMTVSLNRKAFNSDGNKDVTEIDVLKDITQINPLLQTQRRDVKDMLTKGLSRAERLIVILYYYEEMTMKEIGLTLDLSESRVSQMHSSILQRLKAQLQDRASELEPDEDN